MVYDVERDEAHFGAAHVEGRALVWSWTRRGPADGRLAVRCDRVDFPPGSVAHLHTHPGPGLHVLLQGRIRIETRGHVARYGPFEWVERDRPRPRATPTASATEETAFVRVLVLPAEWAGKRTIRYVDPADEDKPKLQRATGVLRAPL